MQRREFEDLCKRVLDSLDWRRHNNSICCEVLPIGDDNFEDIDLYDPGNAYQLYLGNCGVVCLDVYTGSEALCTILWTKDRRIWRNNITQQVLIRMWKEPSVNLQDKIYEELATRTPRRPAPALLLA